MQQLISVLIERFFIPVFCTLPNSKFFACLKCKCIANSQNESLQVPFKVLFKFSPDNFPFNYLSKMLEPSLENYKRFYPFTKYFLPIGESLRLI